MLAVLASKFVSKIPKDHWDKFLLSGVIPINDAFKPYWNTTHSYEVYYGGRGSSKSWFIARKLVKKCLEEKYFKCIYVRKGRVDIKESMYDLLKKFIHQIGKQHEFKFNESTLRITHIRTGNCFVAKGMDDPEKSKGIEEPTCIWCEEITELDQQDFVTLDQNLRTENGILQVFISFNPVHEEHWVRHYFFSKENPHKPNLELGDIICLRTTLKDNFFIDREAYALKLIAGASGNENIIRIVLEGDWGLTENGNPWLHAFRDIGEPNTHIRPVPFLPSYPVYLTFDINADPLSCTAWQKTEAIGAQNSFLHCINEFGGHIKVEDICQQILSAYPNSIFYVTGDRSGQNQDVGRNQTIYQIIQSLLNLSDKQMLLETHNLEHADSRLLCNAMFTHYAIIIDQKCKNLIADCRKATVDPDSVRPSILLKDRGNYKMDYFDGMRYMFQKVFNNYIKEKYFKLLVKK